MKFCEDCTNPHCDEFTSSQKCSLTEKKTPIPPRVKYPLDIRIIAIASSILALLIILRGVFILATDAPPSDSKLTPQFSVPISQIESEEADEVQTNID